MVNVQLQPTWHIKTEVLSGVPTWTNSFMLHLSLPSVLINLHVAPCLSKLKHDRSSKLLNRKWYTAIVQLSPLVPLKIILYLSVCGFYVLSSHYSYCRQMSSVTQRRQYVCLILWQIVIILHYISVTCDRVPWKSVSEDVDTRIHQRSHLLESCGSPTRGPLRCIMQPTATLASYIFTILITQ
jgi:hypothetical protein